MDNRNQNDKRDDRKLNPNERDPRDRGDFSQDPNKKHGEQGGQHGGQQGGQQGKPGNMPKH